MKIGLAGAKRHWYGGMIAGVTVFLVAISLGLAGPAFSDDLRVINGIVNGVSGKYIIMDGEKYDVAGVPVITKGSRNRGNREGIGQGDMVWLSLRDGKVVSIRNYGGKFENISVGSSGDDILFEDEFYPVSHKLHQAVGAHPVWASAGVGPARNLSFQKGIKPRHEPEEIKHHQAASKHDHCSSGNVTYLLKESKFGEKFVD